MQTRMTHHFKMEPESNILVCGHHDCVSLLLGVPSGGHEVTVEFSPCHLPALRDLVLELEGLQHKQRQKDETASAVEMAEKDEVPA